MKLRNGKIILVLMLSFILCFSMTACKTGSYNPEGEPVVTDIEEFTVTDEASMSTLLTGTWSFTIPGDRAADFFITLSEDGTFSAYRDAHKTTYEGEWSLSGSTSSGAPNVLSFSRVEHNDELLSGSTLGDFYIDDIAVIEYLPVIVVRPAGSQNVFKDVYGSDTVRLAKTSREILIYGEEYEKNFDTTFNAYLYNAFAPSTGQKELWLVEDDNEMDNLLSGTGKYRAANCYYAIDDATFNADWTELLFDRGLLKVHVNEDGEITSVSWVDPSAHPQYEPVVINAADEPDDDEQVAANENSETDEPEQPAGETASQKQAPEQPLDLMPEAAETTPEAVTN